LQVFSNLFGFYLLLKELPLVAFQKQKNLNIFFKKLSTSIWAKKNAVDYQITISEFL